MKIAYLEDDKQQMEIISNILLAGLRNEEILIESFDRFSNSEEFLAQWHPKKYDLIILDILMQEDATGVDIARIIRTQDQWVRIVFCSSSNEYACESYEVSADYYLTKPVTYNKMSRLIGKIKPNLDEEEKFVIYCKGRKINVNHIIITKYYNHVITIHMKNGEEIKVRLSQREFIYQVSKYSFMVVVDPGTIVNMKEIVSLKDGNFIMSNGMQAGISRRRKQAVMEAYNEFVFEELGRI